MATPVPPPLAPQAAPAVPSPAAPVPTKHAFARHSKTEASRDDWEHTRERDAPVPAPVLDAPNYTWDLGWRQTGRMLQGLRKQDDKDDTDIEEACGQRAEMADRSKLAAEREAEQLERLPPLDPSLSLWTAAATLEQELHAMQRRSSYSLRRSVASGIRGVLRVHIGWAVLFYCLHVLCSLALPLIAFALLQVGSTARGAALRRGREE